MISWVPKGLLSHHFLAMSQNHTVYLIVPGWHHCISASVIGGYLLSYDPDIYHSNQVCNFISALSSVFLGIPILSEVSCLNLIFQSGSLHCNWGFICIDGLPAYLQGHWASYMMLIISSLGQPLHCFGFHCNWHYAFTISHSWTPRVLNLSCSP